MMSTFNRRTLLAGSLATAPIAAAHVAMAQGTGTGASALLPAVTGPLTAFISGSGSAQFPTEIQELAKRHILDTLASIVACHGLAPAEAARRYALGQTGGLAHGATILGSADRAAVVDAAFANAMAGHSAEINDYSPSAFVQPGPSVVSVSMALAQTRNLSGQSVLNAVIAGYELACRVPKALGMENLRRSGLANHGIGPTFGCGAAAASLLNLPATRVADVLSYCSEQASGSWQWLLDTDHIEKAFVFAGMGARNGLQAALMVEAGFTGVHDNLDRKGGWLGSGVFNGPDSDMTRAYLIDGLGVNFELPLVGYKRYPAGGPTQAGVEGLLKIVDEVDPSQIVRVTIAMPGDVAPFRDAAMPALNLRYMAALILIDRRLSFVDAQSRDRLETDVAVRLAMDRVNLVSDPSQERQPRVESARVTVILADGQTKSVLVDRVAGFPTKPLSHEDVNAKAVELLSPRLGAARANALADMVWTLDSLPNVDRIVGTLGA